MAIKAKIVKGMNGIKKKQKMKDPVHIETETSTCDGCSDKCKNHGTNHLCMTWDGKQWIKKFCHNKKEEYKFFKSYGSSNKS